MKLKVYWDYKKSSRPASVGSCSSTFGQNAEHDNVRGIRDVARAGCAAEFHGGVLIDSYLQWT